MANLTHKQFLFVQYYEGNGTDAARKAGYEGNDAVLAQVASENLRKPDIHEAINTKQLGLLSPVVADRATRMRFWTDVMNNTDLGLRDRLRASELLAKVDGDFIQKQEKIVTQSISLANLVREADKLED